MNVTTQITSKFRIGAQGYVRNVGELGNGHVTLDWAFGDYRFRDWLGIRAGQVKTVQGFYTDTQDMEFLHTWALLPQSLYPIDLRGLTISHLGADLYGAISPRRAGTFQYTIYSGRAPADRGGGEAYGLQGVGEFIKTRTGTVSGADLKWNTPITGLDLGISYSSTPRDFSGANILTNGDFSTHLTSHQTGFAARYSHRAWKIEWERTRQIYVSSVENAFGIYGPPVIYVPYDSRGWYAAATYRLSRHVEVGSYHSRFYPNADRQVSIYGYYQAPELRHIYDQAITASFDMFTHWDLKVEGHFMNGYGDSVTTRGFYPQDNPQGLRPSTNLLVIRLGFNL